jgi:3-methyladenine DNA glycosylase AlkD
MPKNEIVATLQSLANPEIAEHSQRFFKTGKGEYGEGDRFLGIRVPVVRQQVRAFSDLPLEDVVHSLQSAFHEVRLCAVLILVRKFERGSPQERAEIYQTYLDHTQYVNNWDLVDSSAHKIVGPFLADKDREILRRLAASSVLWERRIAIMSTLHFIKCDEYEDTLELAEILLNDPEDLIHKAVGWMLREVGNRNGTVERGFLEAHYQFMPRTMLRYAIEKFPEAERKRYLAGLI